MWGHCHFAARWDHPICRSMGPGERAVPPRVGCPISVRASILEMLLLDQCRALICNGSLFTAHARLCAGVLTILTDDSASEYGDAF